MNKIEAIAIANFLEELSTRFGYDGCNDMRLLATDENYELIKNAEMNNLHCASEEEWHSHKEYNPIKAHMSNFKSYYYTNNYLILDYVRDVFLKEQDLNGNEKLEE